MCCFIWKIFDIVFIKILIVCFFDFDVIRESDEWREVIVTHRKVLKYDFLKYSFWRFLFILFWNYDLNVN